MTRLLVDVGNTAIKWCRDSGAALGPTQRCGRSIDSLLATLDEADVTADAVAICSVAGEAFDAAMVQALVGHGLPAPRLARTEARTGGLSNSYTDPARMGVDRWLAMLAAWGGGPEPVCVVDAGTALTIDLVDARGGHEGGYIIPGIPLMVQALVGGTDRIAVEAGVKPALTPGTSTSDCVNHGVWLATYGALKAVLARAPEHRVVVTGGNGQGLLSLGINGEWRPQLVFEGLRDWDRLRR